MRRKDNIFDRLFIFEMANNHMGNPRHGVRIIREIAGIARRFKFNFAFKLQYRDLGTFIHPSFKNRKDIKHVRRFQETRLDGKHLKGLKNAVSGLGLISICTPFDERSVDLIEKHGFDIIKIGSCSFTDWPLLERVAMTDKPIIASTAGASLEDIDKVVSFLEHRAKRFALMHCVAEYPTPKKGLQLNQIDMLKLRYPRIPLGYSTHEDPANLDSIKIAIAKGATVFEKHVGIKTDRFGLNQYSATPEQVKRWLESAQEAFEVCGIAGGKRSRFTEKERTSLASLRRGVFVKRRIKKGEPIELSDTFLAIPAAEGQITANDLSKYTELRAATGIEQGKPLLLSNTRLENNREKVYNIVQQVKGLLKKSNVLVPDKLDFEISHHYGVNRFNEYGCTIINVVNRRYCKKLIVLVPGQKHPEQYHRIKEETYHILHGDVSIDLNGVRKTYKAGGIVTVEQGTRHSFCSKGGAVIEEISSTHHTDDSYYCDPAILKNKNRKTWITHWME